MLAEELFKVMHAWDASAKQDKLVVVFQERLKETDDMLLVSWGKPPATVLSSSLHLDADETKRLQALQSEKKIPVLFTSESKARKDVKNRVLLGIVNKIWNATPEVEERIRAREVRQLRWKTIQAVLPQTLTELDVTLDGLWDKVCSVPFDEWSQRRQG